MVTKVPNVVEVLRRADEDDNILVVPVERSELPLVDDSGAFDEGVGPEGEPLRATGLLIPDVEVAAYDTADDAAAGTVPLVDVVRLSAEEACIVLAGAKPEAAVVLGTAAGATDVLGAGAGVVLVIRKPWLS